MAGNVEDVTTCIVCYEEFRDPQILPCHHSFCKPCVDNMKNARTIKCPMCNAVSDVSLVRPDFRLQQFHLALKEQAQEIMQNVRHTPSAPPLASSTTAALQSHSSSLSGRGGGLGRCDLCDRHPIAYFCEDCQQWLCANCKNIHQKSNATKSHVVVTSIAKNARFASALEAENAQIEGRIVEHQNAVSRWDAAISQSRQTRVDASRRCAQLKQACQQELDIFFSGLQANIDDFTDKTIQKLESNKSVVRSKLQEITSQKREIEKILKNKSYDLSVVGNVLVENVKSYVQSLTSPLVDVQPPVITIARNQSWSSIDAVTLVLQGGTLTDTVREEF